MAFNRGTGIDLPGAWFIGNVNTTTLTIGKQQNAVQLDHSANTIKIGAGTGGAGIIVVNNTPGSESIVFNAPVTLQDSTGLFGDGSDGPGVPANNDILSSDMYYSTLTIGNGVTLNTSNYRIFVKDTLTFAGTSVIQCNGVDGGAAIDAGAITTGSILPFGTLYRGSGLSGGRGGQSQSGLPVGQNGDSNPYGIASAGTISPYGGVGGTATDTGTNTAGSGGTYTANVVQNGGIKLKSDVNFLRDLRLQAYPDGGFIQQIQVSPGGGGGAGAASTLWSGGGGGSSGGIVVIFARKIVNNGGVNGLVKAIGGAGGAGKTGAGLTSGGGGGGTGGLIFVVSEQVPNTFTTGNLIVTGGAAGANGTGMTAGAAGSGYILNL